jgi:hypothetical protein
MSRKHIRAPVPPNNRPQIGGADAGEPTPVVDTTGFQEQDPKRRIGDFVGTGEPARQQPGPLNDAKARRKRGGTTPNTRRSTKR